MIGKMKRNDGKSYTIEMSVPEQPSTTNNVFVFEKNFQLEHKNGQFTLYQKEGALSQKMFLRPEHFIGLLKSTYPDVIVLELYFTSLNVMLKYDITSLLSKQQYDQDKLILDALMTHRN